VTWKRRNNGCSRTARTNFDSARHGLQRNFQFVNELIGIEGAAGKVSSFYFDRGNLPAAIINAKHKFFRIRSFVNIHFPEGDVALS
jgi:hypothetical protein